MVHRKFGYQLMTRRRRRSHRAAVGQGRYVMAPRKRRKFSMPAKKYSRKSKAKSFAEKVKKIVLKVSETKRRMDPVEFDGGTDMVVTSLANPQLRTRSGLWVNSTASGNELSRPDTALIFPPNAVFGAIAKGDNSNEREGDNVDLIYICNQYTMMLLWNAPDAQVREHQRIYVLEFLVCWKNPTIALAMAVDLSDGGDDYTDNVFRILMAAGLFDRQDTLTVIQANTLAANSLAIVATTALEVLKPGYKEWGRDLAVLEVDEKKNGQAIGSVMKHKWHTFKRPAGHMFTNVPLTVTPIRDNLVTATVAAFNNPANVESSGSTTQLKRMGFKIHFKKPIKLKYLISADGSETTPSLPTNKTISYGCLIWSNDGAGGTFKIQRGGCEMRWKDP